MRSGWLALVLFGCGVPVGDSPPVESQRQGLVNVPDPVACTTRYLGVRQGQTCPAAPGAWNTNSLVNVDGVGGVPDLLNRYCVYEWTGAGAEDPGSLPTESGRDDWLTADCHVVGPHGDPVDEVLWANMEGAHLDAADHLPVLPEGNVPPKPIRVAVVDTTPESYNSGYPGGGQFEHGRNVGLAIRALGCPSGGACVAHVSNHLGLPRIAPRAVAPAMGGFFGYQSELAKGIVMAVEAWRNHAGVQQPRLVINLSVGWESRYGGAFAGAEEDSLPPPVRAVHSAITYARCHGALVIASAGNRAYDGHDAGALFPAAWNEKDAPDVEDCDGLVPEASPVHPPVGTDDPLVTAVAALDPLDDALPNARIDTRTRISAPGFHVGHHDGAIGAPATILSGSSMSAAVVSGIVASAWGYTPNKSPAVIIQSLYDSGVDLAVAADVCLGGGPCVDTVRRVSQCQAIQTACASGAPSCPAGPILCPDTPAAFSDTSGTLSSAEEADLAAAIIDVDLTSVSGFGSSMTACGRTIHYTGSSAPAHPCVHEDFESGGAIPWVEPQPGEWGCDICSKTDDVGFIRVSPGSDTTAVAKEGQIVIEDSSLGTQVYDLSTLDPSAAAMVPGDTYKFSGLSTSSTITKAWVQYTVEGDFTPETLVVDSMYLY